MMTKAFFPLHIRCISRDGLPDLAFLIQVALGAHELRAMQCVRVRVFLDLELFVLDPAGRRGRALRDSIWHS
jgi:hypothetical protein